MPIDEVYLLTGYTSPSAKAEEFNYHFTINSVDAQPPALSLSLSLWLSDSVDAAAAAQTN